MKKAINNKIYDTKTAKKIASVQMLAKREGNNSASESIAETLFRKRTGEFFLLREDRFGGNLIPLEYADAKEWGENNSLPDNIMRDTFWESGNVKGKTVLCVTMAQNVALKLKADAAESKKSVSGFLEELLRREFNMKKD